MEKMTKRKQQALATKTHILETAFSLNEHEGFENITVQEICKAAGVSIGAFYHYFSSKESMILEWYKLVDDIFDREVMPELRVSGISSIQKISSFAEYLINQACIYGKESLAQLYRAQLAHNGAGFFSDERALLSYLIELVSTGQSDGELVCDVPAEQITRELLIVMRGAILDYICGGSTEPVEQVTRMVSHYLASYRADK